MLAAGRSAAGRAIARRFLAGTAPIRPAKPRSGPSPCGHLEPDNRPDIENEPGGGPMKLFGNQFRATVAAAIVGTAMLAASAQLAGAQSVLRVVPQADLKNLDPVWTTAIITSNHGYMVYDVLFAMDRELKPQPQMVDTYERSADGMLWTFKLREGLTFHDGSPVEAADAVQSMKRWAARMSAGQTLFKTVEDVVATGPLTFEMRFKSLFGPVLEALAESRQSARRHARGRGAHRSPRADRGGDRLRALHLPARRVGAGAQGGVRQERSLQAALRAGERVRGRQAGPLRPGGVDLRPRSQHRHAGPAHGQGGHPGQAATRSPAAHGAIAGRHGGGESTSSGSRA